MPERRSNPTPDSVVTPKRTTTSNRGLTGMVRMCRPILGPDFRRLPLLVVGCFVLGFLEAGLVLLVVQMAVALAGGLDEFAITVGPFEIADIPLGRGVMLGVVIVGLLVIVLIPIARTAGRMCAHGQLRTRQRMIDAYLGADWDIRSQQREGRLQELLTKYTERAELAVHHLLIAAVAACGLIAILSTAMLASPVVASIAIVCVAGVGALLRPLVRIVRSATADYADAEQSFAGRMAEVARVTPEITAFDVADPVRDNVVEDARSVADSLRVMRMTHRLGASLYQYAALLLIVLAIGALTRFGSDDQLATIGTVMLLLVRALSYGQQLQSMLQSSNEAAPFLETIEEEIAALASSEVDRDGIAVDHPTPLRFDRVSFAYDDSEPVLHEVTFTVDRGEAVGLLGRSGAGKSTILQLMLRLRAPGGGRITCDGIDLQAVSVGVWYRLVAYVPQHNNLVSGTIADNIRFFRRGLSDEVVRSAARRAHLHDEIMALPDGYDTLVGYGIRDLSGGQRQRLGIARALAGDPELIVLDEPTSALDAGSEALVIETLRELRGSVAMLVVTHRPSALSICDRTLHLDAGRIAEITAEAS